MIHKNEPYFFSNCKKTGSTGPSQAEADAFYKNSSLSVTIIGEGIQKWIVPYSGKYTIHAAGASGISSCSQNVGGNGASLASVFKLMKNDVLYILVGQQGISASYGWGGAGGGASFVAKKVQNSDYKFDVDDTYVTPLLVAAGGGGSGDCNDNGNPKSAGSGNCETKEEGAGSIGEEKSAGGAGFATNSVLSTNSFLNGGQGGKTYNGNAYGYGGFGGGGCPYNAGGGGGGFKGGNSGGYAAAGTGGYSFGVDKAVYYSSGSNTGNGFVTIVFKGGLNNCSSKRRTSNNMYFIYYMICLLCTFP